MQFATRKKKVFLHIGLPKTGTSALQTFFCNHRDHFLSEDIYYPVSGSHSLFADGGHHLLAIALIQDRWEEVNLQVGQDVIESAWENVLAEIESTSASNIYLSSEWFAFDVTTTEQISKVKGLLSDFDVQIVITLRDVVQFVNSVYSQRVRDGFDGSVVDYVLLAWRHLNWESLVACWRSAFGQARCKVLNYDAMNKQDFFRAFSHAVFGRSPFPPESVASSTFLKNRSLSFAATNMLREVNASSIDELTKIRVRDEIKALYERIPIEGVPKFIGPDLEAVLRKYCRWPDF